MVDLRDRLPRLNLDPAQEAEIERIVSGMAFAELVSQLGGYRGWSALTPWTYRTSAYPVGGSRRFDFGPMRFTDGPRGINLGRSTCFPSASTRGGTWDPTLEQRVGDAMGLEARARGATAVGSTCVNLIRHPGWGRAQESFGSDAHHVGAMGAGHVRGLRSHVVPVVKHFALNSIENSRFRVNVEVEEATLREVYLPQFRATLRAGASGIMTAYNKVNGTYCGHNAQLLSILRDDWGFDGFVMSDFFLGCRDAGASMRAGLDMEMPQAWHYRLSHLRKLHERGDIDLGGIRSAAKRVLRARAAHQALYHREHPTVVESAHQRLALEAARASIVVAKNRHQVLPVGRTDRIGVVGPLARAAALGSEGSVSVAPPFAISPLGGLKETCRRVSYEPRLSRRAVARLAHRVDVLVVVIGSRPRDEGEYFPLLGGGDRRVLSIRRQEERAVMAAIDSGRPTVVVWVGGGLPTLGDWEARVPCLVFAGHGGMQGGRALAEVLAGEAVGGGHLVACIPRDEDDLPPFDPDSSHVAYDRWFDYRRYDRLGRTPLFNIGHGSAQTVLRSKAGRIVSDTLAPDADVEVRAVISNDGPCTAEPLLTLFAGRANEDGSRERRSLRGFAKCEIAPGESKELAARFPATDLALFDVASGEWRLEAGPHRVWASISGTPPSLLGEVRVRP